MTHSNVGPPIGRVEITYHWNSLFFALISNSKQMAIESLPSKARHHNLVVGFDSFSEACIELSLEIGVFKIFFGV